MNERQLFRALGDVDDSLLEAAERLPHRKKPRHTGLWIAACLCLAALSLAAPYVALFTKGASSADPKAAVSTQDAPGATEAAPRASSDRNGSIQEFAPETQATAPHTQVNTASTAPSQSYSPCPDDFSFSLAWEGNAYDSATGLLARPDGETVPLPLSEEQRQRAWALLSGLEFSEVGEGEQSISLTAYGQTASMNLSQEEEGPAQTILEELIRLICPEEP